MAHNAPEIAAANVCLIGYQDIENAMFPKQLSLELNGRMICIKMAENWEIILLHLLSTKRKKGSTKLLFSVLV